MRKLAMILLSLACLALAVALLGQAARAETGRGPRWPLLAPLLETTADDSYTTNEDTQLSVNPPGVLANDGNVSDLALVTNTTNGTLDLNLNNGRFTYDPAADYFGADAFVYSVISNTVTLTNTVNLTVNPVNDPPAFTLGGNPTVLEDSAQTTLSSWATGMSPGPANESDQTLFSFNLTADNPALFSVQPTLDATTGTLAFTPAANANGSPSVAVSLQDSGGTTNGGVDTGTGSFTITITPVNDAPTFTPGSSPSVLEDAGAVTLSGWATGFSPGPSDESGQSLTLSLTPDNPALFSAQPAISTSTGNLTFTPALNANGSTTVNYTLQDSGGTADGGDDTTTGSFTISITPVNDAPTFTPGSNPSVLEDSGAATFTGWASGISPGPSDESGQSLTLSLTPANPALFSVQPAISTSTGTLTFTPAANTSGTTTVNYTLQDSGGTANSGADTTTGSFTITVATVNEPPTFTVGPNPFVVQNSGAATYTSWATGISAGPPDESGQTLTFNLSLSAGDLAKFSVPPAVNAVTGTLTFTLAPGAYGENIPVTITLTDDGDPPEATTGNFTITINDYPNTTEDFVSPPLVEDISPPAIMDVLANDTDQIGGIVDSTLAITPFGQGFLGVAAVIDLPTNPRVQYTPYEDAFGTDYVEYQICDLYGICNTEILTIEIIGVNDAPVAVDDTYYMLQNSILTADTTQGVLSNDTDIDTAAASLQIYPFSVTYPTIGVLNISADGSFAYTPPTDFIGSVTFTYRAFDTIAPSNLATVTIEVSTNIPPVAQNDAYTLNEDTPLNIAASGVLANDSDPDGVTLTAALESPPDHGALTLNSNGSFTYTPEANYYGTDSFTYRARDYLSGSPVATVTLTINPVNDPPAASDDTFTLNLNTIQGGNLVAGLPGVLANDVDVDPGDVLSASLLSAPTSGSVVLNPDGSFVYTRASDAVVSGTATFTYQVSDGTVTDSATVQVTIDLVAPTVTWVQPATSPLVLPTSRQPLPLNVLPTDSSGITQVDYKYYNVAQGAWITLASLTASPWDTEVMPVNLNPGFSDIRAWVYDLNGNLTVSERVIIWRPLEIFMPRVSR